MQKKTDFQEKDESKRLILNVVSEDMPEITINEIKQAPKKMKKQKTSGPVGVLSEMLQ